SFLTNKKILPPLTKRSLAQNGLILRLEVAKNLLPPNPAPSIPLWCDCEFFVGADEHPPECLSETLRFFRKDG
ncbi:MAG: hypothetical protein RMK94_17480, partial [Armatimonadota bacterium]|nr:hypothetical protein [Armatimonadota bacterium]